MSQSYKNNYSIDVHWGSGDAILIGVVGMQSSRTFLVTMLLMMGLNKLTSVEDWILGCSISRDIGEDKLHTPSGTLQEGVSGCSRPKENQERDFKIIARILARLLTSYLTKAADETASKQGPREG